MNGEVISLNCAELEIRVGSPVIPVYDTDVAVTFVILDPSPVKEPEKEPLAPPSAPVRSKLAPDPEIINEPVTEAVPVIEPSHSAVTPVNPLPSPTYEPLNDPLTPPVASVKSAFSPEPDTVNEPVMPVVPVCILPAKPVNPLPSPVNAPTNDPVNDPVNGAVVSSNTEELRLVKALPSPLK